MTPELISYIAEYIREEYERCSYSNDFLNSLEDFITKVVEAYEGGAR